MNAFRSSNEDCTDLLTKAKYQEQSVQSRNQSFYKTEQLNDKALRSRSTQGAGQEKLDKLSGSKKLNYELKEELPSAARRRTPLSFSEILNVKTVEKEEAKAGSHEKESSISKVAALLNAQLSND